MFWADRLAGEIRDTRLEKAAGKPLIIRDEKTMSGRVHIGSMRGVAIHGLLAEVLAERGAANEYHFEVNDFDDFDSIPPALDQETFAPYLAMPLYKVPSPEAGHENFAEYYAAEFIAVHRKAGFTPSYYRAYADLYKAGKMNACIKLALERAAGVRRILKEASGSVKDESWLPVSMVCEQCGKLKTTRAYDFDGETVAYACDQSPYGSMPCGHEGRLSPYDGNAKLFWKVDWAAKWVAMGVGVEGGGKDHMTKGGSHDVASRIAQEIFGYETPFNVPYEFFLVGGKKMASSKGRGASAHEIAELFPPEVLRLVLLGKDINQQIEVDPDGDSVPRWYDWHDELAEKIREGVADDFTRLYQLTKLPEDQAEGEAPWQLRFGQVAFIVQMPHLSLEREAERAKGSPLTETEKAKLIERAAYARFWLATYAPEQYRFTLQDALPAAELSAKQREALAALAPLFADSEKTGEEIQNRVFELKNELRIEPKELFGALYQIFLARSSGPKIGWFLSVLPRAFVHARLLEAAA